MKTCQALDQNGLRCSKRKGAKLVQYHGDSEIYSYFDATPKEPQWVLVMLCPEHRKEERKTNASKAQ